MTLPPAPAVAALCHFAREVGWPPVIWWHDGDVPCLRHGDLEVVAFNGLFDLWHAGTLHRSGLGQTHLISYLHDLALA